MTVSVCVAFRNDLELIYETVGYLCEGQDLSLFEIIIYNDGSVDDGGKFYPLREDSFKYPNITVINNPTQRGVGFALDRAVEHARGTIIVLMGSDIVVRRSWLSDVLQASEGHPNSIGCTACVGLNPDEKNIDHEGRNIRYGAELIVQVGLDDLSIFSELIQKKPDYTALMEAMWIRERQPQESFEIPCLLGAFYFCHKEWYEKIRGFDTDPNVMYQGHLRYGSLEPILSLKSYLMGGSILCFPDIETGHLFGRVTQKNRFTKRSTRQDLHWWNRLWIIETMIFDEGIKKKLIDFVNPTLAFNTARRDIRKNYATVVKIREKNRTEFKRDFQWFLDKFDIKIK